MGAYIKMTVITKTRKERKVSQQELAEKSGVSLSAIRAYEQGRYTPKYEAVEKMCDALEIPVNAVYEELTTHDSPLDFELSWLKNGGGAHLGNDTGREALALHRFRQLNEAGQRNALDLLELVTKIPEYRK